MSVVHGDCVEHLKTWVEGLPVPKFVSEDQLVFEMEETK